MIGKRRASDEMNSVREGDVSLHLVLSDTRDEGGHVCPLQAGMDYAPLILARCSSCTHETCVYICLCSCVITAGSSPLVSVSPEPPGSAKKPHWFCQRAWHTSANTLALFLVESPGAVECIETHPASTGDGVVIRLPRSLANKEASDNKKN